MTRQAKSLAVVIAALVCLEAIIISFLDLSGVALYLTAAGTVAGIARAAWISRRKP